MSNHLAAGNAQTPGNQANQNGQNSGAPASNNNSDDNTPVVLSAEDIAAQAAADAADAGAPAGDAGDAGDGNRVPQPRFNEVVAERNASMEYANYWRNEALRLMGQGAAGAAAGANPEPVDEDPEPTLEEHGHDVAKYMPAHSAWTRREIARQVSSGVNQGMQQASAQQRDQLTVGTYQSRAAEFAATKPDFGIVTSNPALQITKPMTAVILQSPVGPAIAYHLATNPAECTRISRLDPVQQAAALGKLEAKLEKPTPPAGGAPGGAAPGAGGTKPGKPSRAPDPPSTSRPGGAPDINMRNCSLSEYLDQRVPQIAKMQSKSGGNTR